MLPFSKKEGEDASGAPASLSRGAASLGDVKLVAICGRWGLVRTCSESLIRKGIEIESPWLPGRCGFGREETDIKTFSGR